jgi:hypothetical protein
MVIGLGREKRIVPRREGGRASPEPFASLRVNSAKGETAVELRRKKRNRRKKRKKRRNTADAIRSFRSFRLFIYRLFIYRRFI